MKINIKGTNIELSPSIYAYIEKKIGELSKFIPDFGEIQEIDGRVKSNVEAWVEVERTTKHHKKGTIFRAEAQIKIPGQTGVRAESCQWDLHVAIDEVKDELQRQIKKYKGKRSAIYKRSARSIKKLLSLSPLARFWRRGRIREE